MFCVLTLLLPACGGGNTTSSSGPTEFAGSYVGTISSGGFSAPLRITITQDGFVLMRAAGGVVCPGDLPASIGLDGKNFSSTTSEQCIFGGTTCPVNTSVSGAVSGDTVAGSGQVLLGCPNAPTQPVTFTFVALEE